MIHVRDFQKGIIFFAGDDLYEIVQCSPLRLRDLRTWKIVSKKFHSSHAFEEAEIARSTARFLYGGDGIYMFCDAQNPAVRFPITDAQIGDRQQFLVFGKEVEVLKWNGRIINVTLSEES